MTPEQARAANTWLMANGKRNLRLIQFLLALLAALVIAVAFAIVDGRDAISALVRVAVIAAAVAGAQLVLMLSLQHIIARARQTRPKPKPPEILVSSDNGRGWILRYPDGRERHIVAAQLMREIQYNERLGYSIRYDGVRT